MNPKAAKILLVDDDEVVGRVWSRALQKEGFQVSVAADGAAGLDKAKSEPFDVIFTDLRMPGIDGQEFLRHLKDSGHQGCVNVISGQADIALVVACVKLGACDYLQKPCDLAELLALTRRCLGHAATRRENKRLQSEVARYEELDRLKSQFVSTVSHELRTPLFSMIGAFDLLAEAVRARTQGTEQGLLSVIQNNMNRLAGLIGNLLDFSRLEQGALRPSFQEVDIGLLVQETVHALAPLFARRNLEPPVLPNGLASKTIEADPDQIRQVLTNLISNAIKFTPPRGGISIDLAGSKETIELVVSDTGIGIAPENHKKIFDRFYQVDGSLTREAGGAGIGLSIVEEIVRLHGGKIWVESVLGRGSQFHVVLPKKQQSSGVQK
ncbi:MAG: response regulator [Elusimicrobia bacterium]|nr:response regulator [Elusimicrobiota bacterium]